MSNEIVSLWDAEIEYKKNRILALSFAGIATERIVAQKKPPMGSRRLLYIVRDVRIETSNSILAPQIISFNMKGVC